MPVTADTRSLGPQPNPAGSYTAAMKRVGRLQLADAVASPGGESIVLVHGRRTERAIVLFHGFTNSPRQFRAIAQQLHERGDNVLVPRLPYHALADGTVHDLANLTAEQLRDVADTATDIARGLGDSVIVAGLSLGGTLAAWTAQFRPEVDRAVPLSPALALAHVPPIPDPVLLRVVMQIPDQARSEGIDGSRPDRTLGWSSHAIGQMVRFGVAVMDAARTSAPAARDIRMLLNAHDHTVSRRRNLELAGRWASSGGNVAAWEFRDALQLSHDFVDPGERSANIAATHPVIRALIDGKQPASNAVYRLHLEQELSVPLEAEVLSAAEDPNTHR